MANYLIAESFDDISEAALAVCSFLKVGQDRGKIKSTFALGKEKTTSVSRFYKATPSFEISCC